MRDSLWDDHQGAWGKALLATEMQGGSSERSQCLDPDGAFPDI